MRFIDLTDRRYERLIVIGLSGNKNKTNHLLWNCQCECGKIIECSGTSLNTGNTKSCGCIKKEMMSKRMSTHCDGKSKEYLTWANIKSRCNNTNLDCYKNYGGRGIKVCDKWLNSFEAFLKDMGRAPTSKHSIDRIDNNRNYEPENCRWATRIEQNNNKRDNKKVSICGLEFNTQKDFRLYLGITKGQFDHRKLVLKESIEQIFKHFKSKQHE